MKIVMKTLFEKQYTKEVILTCIAPEQQICENTGPVSWTEEGVVSLYDLSSNRA